MAKEFSESRNKESRRRPRGRPTKAEKKERITVYVSQDAWAAAVLQTITQDRAILSEVVDRCIRQALHVDDDSIVKTLIRRKNGHAASAAAAEKQG